MFKIEPDAVEIVMGGIADIEREIVTHGAETGTFAGANLFQNLAFSHHQLSRLDGSLRELGSRQ
jgi:hypothetical protein